MFKLNPFFVFFKSILTIKNSQRISICLRLEGPEIDKTTIILDTKRVNKELFILKFKMIQEVYKYKDGFESAISYVEPYSSVSKVHSRFIHSFKVRWFGF